VSYGRNPYYIFNSGNKIHFDGTWVDEDIVDAFLYKILLKPRRDELKRRLLNGKKQWVENKHYLDKDFNFQPLPKDNEEYIEEMKWLEKLEDKLIKSLMG
jgi:hypothetical protein